MVMKIFQPAQNLAFCSGGRSELCTHPYGKNEDDNRKDIQKSGLQLNGAVAEWIGES